MKLIIFWFLYSKVIALGLILYVSWHYELRDISEYGMGFDTSSSHGYVDLGDWSGSTCAVNPAACQQGKEFVLFGPENRSSKKIKYHSLTKKER